MHEFRERRQWTGSGGSSDDREEWRTCTFGVEPAGSACGLDPRAEECDQRNVKGSLIEPFISTFGSTIDLPFGLSHWKGLYENAFAGQMCALAVAVHASSAIILLVWAREECPTGWAGGMNKWTQTENSSGSCR